VEGGCRSEKSCSLKHSRCHNDGRVYLFLDQKAIGNLQKIRLLRDYYVIVFGVTKSWKKTRQIIIQK
jgi:hypothetical protein